MLQEKIQKFIDELRQQVPEDKRNGPGFIAVIPRRFEVAVYLEVDVDDFKQAFWTDTPSEAAIAGIGEFLQDAVRDMPGIARDIVTGGYEIGALELLVIVNLVEPVATLLMIPKGLPLSQALKRATVITQVMMTEPELETIH